MNALNRFNWIAPFYDQLAWFVFGNAIYKAQTSHLSCVQKHSRVLVLGGGTGKWLRELVRLNESCTIFYVEASSKMLDKAKENLNDSDRIKFIHGTEDNLRNEQFDIIITHFFLDMYTNLQLTQLTKKIKSLMNGKDARWLVADFENSKFWHVPFLTIMYYFFNVTNSISTRHLPNWNVIIEDNSFQCINATSYYGKFIRSRVYTNE